MKRVREGFPGERLTVIPPAIQERCTSLPVIRDLFVTDIGHFPSAHHHYVDRPQGTSEMIFIYCTDGSGWCELDGREVTAEDGSALFIPPDTPHTYGADPDVPWSICWAHVAGRRTDEYLDALEITRKNSVLYVPDTRLIVETFEEVYAHVHHGYANVSLLSMSTALAHLFGTIKNHERSPHERGRQREEKILRSIQYMREHLDEACTLDELAGAAQLSASHYSHLFKLQTNTSPVKFFIRLKMQRACELLYTTNQTVAAIAIQVGYDDPFHFSRMFKKVIGISPSEYRNKEKA